MQKKHIAYLQMVTASVLWSTAGIFMKQINSNPFSISGFRSLFAALCVFLCIKAEKQKIILNKKNRAVCVVSLRHVHGIYMCQQINHRGERHCFTVHIAHFHCGDFRAVSAPEN